MGNCGKCKFWGNGDGTGIPYNAGHINTCKNPQIDGQQHPSYGVGSDLKTMVYAGRETQTIQTRVSFGCILFEPIYVQLGGKNENPSPQVPFYGQAI